MSEAFPPHVEDTIRAITQLDLDHRDGASRSQRWVDGVTGLVGRPRFLGLVGLGVVLWGAGNVGAGMLGWPVVDPPPFAWLGSVVSLCALFVVVLILITQRREEVLARHHARLTLQLTILGEQKTAKVIALLEELRRDDPRLRNRVDAQAEAMAAPADSALLLEVPPG